MVRREGTRFGVTTSHNVRRLPFPYKYVYAQQNVVIETKIEGQSHQAKKQTKAALGKRMLEKGAFNIKEDSEKSVTFSLNKAKRWEVIKNITEEADYHGDHDIIKEHHMLQGSSCTCIGVYDSSTGKVKRSMKTYAKAADLMRKVEREKEAERENNEDFGKKNCRRSRKRRARQEREEALSIVQYDVTLAAPKQTYYCNTTGNSDYGKRNRNSRNRTKKLHQCNLSEVFSDGLWQLDEDYFDMEEEEYWQEETKDAEPIQKCGVHLETLITKRMSSDDVCCAVDEQERSSSSQRQVWSTKDRVFPIDRAAAITALHPEYIIPIRKLRAAKKLAQIIRDQEEEQKKHTGNVLPEKPIVMVSVLANDLTTEKLRGEFGDCFMEGQCVPRRFAINITDRVSVLLRSSQDNPGLASILQQTAHQIFTVIDCMLDPMLEVREDDSLAEKIRVKVRGVYDEEEILTNALSHMENVGILDVVNAVSQSVALQPAENYLMETFVPTLSTKPALAVDTIHSALGWQYDVTNVNKAVHMSLDEGSECHSETGAVIPSEALHVGESCSICFEEFDEKCCGTALRKCSHWFCDECWRNHLQAKINQGDINITCPEFKCTIAVDMVTMMSLVPSKQYSRYHANKANIALLRQPELQWCPSPCCGRLLRLAGQNGGVSRNGMMSVNCECGMFWCSLCKQEAHWPATCQQAENYRKKAKDLIIIKCAETVRVDTKSCPKCFYPIEKYYGCNHMICKCGHEFCWECGKDFHNTHYHCINRERWKRKVYVLHAENIVEKSAVELAVGHHKKRTKDACHRRARKAKKLAVKVVHSHSDSSSAISSTSNNRPSVSKVTDSLLPSPKFNEMRRILAQAASFLSEGEFVLEHLEILLAGAPPTSHKRLLSQHKTRLIFITEKLHKIFNEDVKLDIQEVQHLVHCGKNCLRWVAMAAAHLSSRLASGATMD